MIRISASFCPQFNPLLLSLTHTCIRGVHTCTHTHAHTHTRTHTGTRPTRMRSRCALTPRAGAPRSSVAACGFSCALSSPSPRYDIILWQCHHSCRCCIENLELWPYCELLLLAMPCWARGAHVVEGKKINVTRHRVNCFNGVLAYCINDFTLSSGSWHLLWLPFNC